MSHPLALLLLLIAKACFQTLSYTMGMAVDDRPLPGKGRRRRHYLAIGAWIAPGKGLGRSLATVSGSSEKKECAAVVLLTWHAISKAMALLIVFMNQTA
ncbi:hypothetical protein [Modicisalibacter radicis]|uniref:hypothetical protein n=1 Tax=Halomonas sp. EAR18 TaxID=2518972 RepID=UPI00109C33EC|nr:hypothetical protein [Halomonas sp. EAR18]